MLRLLMGVLLGAGLALLLAPSPGRETRRRWAEQARERAPQAKELAGLAAQRARELAEQARHRFG